MSEQQNQQQNPEDKLGLGLQILSFCIPLVGIIIYFTSKNESPKKAKTACYAALIGIGVGIIFQILTVVIGGAAY